MGIPKVAIVGRPNVGKSSLLNWLADRLISVVDPTAGVTRDRVTWIMHERDRYFELMDTGGIGIVELGLTTALVAFGGANAGVVAAVLIYRFLTVVPTLVLGGFAALTWRSRAAVPADG